VVEQPEILEHDADARPLSPHKRPKSGHAGRSNSGQNPTWRLQFSFRQLLRDFASDLKTLFGRAYLSI
jgi:hypothetical protein